MPHEAELLRRIVAVADRIASFEATIAEEGDVLQVEGGPKVHPAVVEVRQLDRLLGQLVAQLRVPDEEGQRPQTRGGARGYYSRQRMRAVQ
jgi:hypothetical protein